MRTSRLAKRPHVATAQPPCAAPTGELDVHVALHGTERLFANASREPRGRRPAHLEREIGPADALCAVLILVADVDAADVRDLVVDDQDLAVVATKPSDEERAQRMEDVDLHAVGLQLRAHDAARHRRAPAVDDDVHVDAAGCGRAERVHERAADALIRKRVDLEMDALFRGGDRFEHAWEGFPAAIEQ